MDWIFGSGLFMRLHLKNISPEVHGLIVQHKAEHSHKNLDETVECLIKARYELKAECEHLFKLAQARKKQGSD